MRKLLWKRRIATLLIMCMVATQMVVPVSAQSSNPSKDVETLEIPTEYETIDCAGESGNVVDLTKTEEALVNPEEQEEEPVSSLKTYGSIPIVKKQEETTITAVSEKKNSAGDYLPEEEIVTFSFDEDGYAKTSVTTTPGVDTWVRFVPSVSGNYVLCTENDNDPDTEICMNLYAQGEDDFLSARSSYNNVYFSYNYFEAGKTYYYQIWVESSFTEVVDLVMYPEEEILYDAENITSVPMRKAVAYKVSVPEPGFYTIKVDGNDSEYLMDIHGDDVRLSDERICAGTEKVFRFAVGGDNVIRIHKAQMSDEEDNIIFSFKRDDEIEEITEQEKVTEVDYKEGKWFKYVPKETGLYTLILKTDEYWEIDVEACVEAQDGEEIVEYENLGFWEDYISQEKICAYKLEAGCTYYYKVASWCNEEIGVVGFRMNKPNKTISMTDENIPKIVTEEKILLLETDFAKEKVVKCRSSWDGQIVEVTEGNNGSVHWIEDGTYLGFPEGNHTFLVYLYGTEEKELEFKALNTQGFEENTKTITLSANDCEKWLKFVPETTGFYALSEIGVTEGKKANVALYRQSENYISENQFLIERADMAHLEQGTVYFYKVSAKDVNQEEELRVELMMTKLESSGEMGEGDCNLSLHHISMLQVQLEPNKYYSISLNGEKQGYKITFYKNIGKKNRERYTRAGNISLSTGGAMVSFTEKDLRYPMYAFVTKACYTQEAEEVSFAVQETQYEKRTISMGQTIQEEANASIKQYSFTPETSGRYSFIISADSELKKTSKYQMLPVSVSATLYSDGVTNCSYMDEYDYNKALSYILEAGTEYCLTIPESQAYEIKLTEVTRKLVFDYDYYLAFIASGGTINIVDDLTDEMCEKEDDDYAYDYYLGGSKWLFIDTSDFINQNDIWRIGAYEDAEMEADMVPYQDVVDKLNMRRIFGPSIVTKEMYISDDNNLTKFHKVELSEKIGKESVLLAYTEPSRVLIQQITLSGLTAMEVGQTSKLSVTTSTLNKYKPTNPGVVFTSSNPNVVSVDASGNMTAKSAGKAVITCTSVDGNAKQSITVTVKQSIITALTVTITGAEDTLYVGDKMSLDATIGTGGKGKPTVDGVNWSSSDTSVATVDKDGTVLGKKEGTVVITATSKDGYAKNSVTIQVKPVLAKKITLNESKIRMKKGSSYKWLEVTFSPKNTTDKSVTWKSSNKKVATVSSKGVIKAKSVGTAVITATTENGKKDTVKVTVTASNIKVIKIILDKKMTALAGDVIKLKPEIDPVNATNKKVSYKSSDPDVASVTNAGVVTAKKPGKATITVTAKDGTGKKATCTITVKAPEEPKKLKVKSNQKKTATLSWETVDKADGYIIYMSTSKKGKYKVAATIKGAKTNQYTIKKLKSKTKYYFKIVSYVNVGKKKVYSDETKVVNVKIK